MSPRLARACAAAALAACAATGNTAFALEHSTLYRNSRIQAMGGAQLAVAKGADALYLNPAGLADASGSRVDLLSTDTTASTDAIRNGSTGAKAFSSFSGAALNELLGQEFHFQEQIRMTFIGENFGMGYLLDGQYALIGKNRSLPNVIVGHQTTNGIQAGGGFSLGRGNRGRGRAELRVGGSVKYFYRRGGYHELPSISLARMGAPELGQVLGNPGSGIGFDVGTQALFRLREGVELRAALSWLDIGGTALGPDADEMAQNLGFGLGLTQQLSKASWTIAADIQHLLTTTDPRKRIHLGAELALPVVSLNVGLNQLRLSFGAGVNLWLLRFDTAYYTESVGVLTDQAVEGRWSLRAMLTVPLK